MLIYKNINMFGNFYILIATDSIILKYPLSKKAIGSELSQFNCVAA